MKYEFSEEKKLSSSVCMFFHERKQCQNGIQCYDNISVNRKGRKEACNASCVCQCATYLAISILAGLKNRSKYPRNHTYTRFKESSPSIHLAKYGEGALPSIFENEDVPVFPASHPLHSFVGHQIFHIAASPSISKMGGRTLLPPISEKNGGKMF